MWLVFQTLLFFIMIIIYSLEVYMVCIPRCPYTIPTQHSDSASLVTSIVGCAQFWFLFLSHTHTCRGLVIHLKLIDCIHYYYYLQYIHTVYISTIYITLLLEETGHYYSIYYYNYELLFYYYIVIYQYVYTRVYVCVSCCFFNS